VDSELSIMEPVVAWKPSALDWNRAVMEGKPTMVEGNAQEVQTCQATISPGGVFSGTPTFLKVLPALQGKPKSC